MNKFVTGCKSFPQAANIITLYIHKTQTFPSPLINNVGECCRPAGQPTHLCFTICRRLRKLWNEFVCFSWLYSFNMWVRAVAVIEFYELKLEVSYFNQCIKVYPNFMYGSLKTTLLVEQKQFISHSCYVSFSIRYLKCQCYECTGKPG